MKYTTIIMAMIFLPGGFYHAAAQQRTAEAMLRDPAKQQEIFHAIATDSAQTRQFMQHLMETKATPGKHQMMGYMKENKESMENIMNDSVARKRLMAMMMERMEMDSAACKSMCEQMSANPHMKAIMQGGGHAKGEMMKSEMHCPMHHKMGNGKMKNELKQ